MVVGAPGFEPGTSCAQGNENWSNSVILQHGWQRKSTSRHAQDSQVVPKWYSALFNSPMHIPNQLRDTALRCQVHWRDLSQHHDVRTAMTPRSYRKKTVDSIPSNGDEPAIWIGLPMRCTMEVPLTLRPDRRENQISFRTIATACPRACALTKLHFLFRLRCPRRLRFSNDKTGNPHAPKATSRARHVLRMKSRGIN